MRFSKGAALLLICALGPCLTSCNAEENRSDFAMDFFDKQRALVVANGSPPPLGLHTLMQESTAEKIRNMIDNIANDYVAPVEVLARKT